MSDRRELATSISTLSLDNISIVTASIMSRKHYAPSEEEKKIIEGVLHVYNQFIPTYLLENQIRIVEAKVEVTSPFKFTLIIDCVDAKDQKIRISGVIDVTKKDDKVINFDIANIKKEFDDLNTRLSSLETQGQDLADQIINETDPENQSELEQKFAKLQEDSKDDDYDRLNELKDPIEDYYRNVAEFNEDYGIDNCKNPDKIDTNPRIFYIAPNGKFEMLCSFNDLYIISKFCPDKYLNEYTSIEELINIQLAPAVDSFERRLQLKGLQTDTESKKAYLKQLVSETPENLPYGTIDRLLSKSKYGTLSIYSPTEVQTGERTNLRTAFEKIQTALDAARGR